jgi:hypothetical protein
MVEDSKTICKPQHAFQNNDRAEQPPPCQPGPLPRWQSEQAPDHFW